MAAHDTEQATGVLTTISAFFHQIGDRTQSRFVRHRAVLSLLVFVDTALVQMFFAREDFVTIRNTCATLREAYRKKREANKLETLKDCTIADVAQVILMFDDDDELAQFNLSRSQAP